MGSLRDPRPATANSVMTVPASYKLDDGFSDGGAVGEPLIQHVQQVHSDSEIDEKIQDPPMTPPINTSFFQPLSSHPIETSSPEEPAPPPPDFTRRGIHIPTRTR